MYNSTYEIEKEEYDIAAVGERFDLALVILNYEGYEQTTMQQLAQARMALGEGHDISEGRNWVQEGFIYLPKDPNNILVVDGKHNPILKHPKDAVVAHQKSKEYFVDASKLLEIAKKDARAATKSGVLLFPRDDLDYDFLHIPTQAFADHPLSSFLLRESAQAYGQFLKNGGVAEFRIDLANKHRIQAARESFAYLLQDGCAYESCGCCLDGSSNLEQTAGLDRVCGVRKSAKICKK